MQEMRRYLYELATDKRAGFVAGFFKLILFFLSLAYGIVVTMLIFKRRLCQVRLGCAVISVGNVTFGGTGKTPLVELVARFLFREGKKVAIISRGYGKGRGTADEPLLLSRKLKEAALFVDADRVRAGRVAVEKYQADAVIFDDGLQQWHIKKDLQIVTVDAANPFGNGHLLPRGILRQPLRSLDDVDIFVITKANIGTHASAARARLAAINSRAAIFEAGHVLKDFYVIGKEQESRSPEFLSGKKVFLFCGIADPDSFFFLVKEAGAVIAGQAVFGDHHCYCAKDLEMVREKAVQAQAELIVTTEKDAVKLSSRAPGTAGLEIGVLSMEIEIRNGKEFYNRLRSVYRL